MTKAERQELDVLRAELAALRAEFASFRLLSQPVIPYVPYVPDTPYYPTTPWPVIITSTSNTCKESADVLSR